MTINRFAFQVTVQTPVNSRLKIDAVAAAESTSDALRFVKERLSRHQSFAIDISPCQIEHASREYARVLASDWAVSLADASLDLPDWSPFSELSDAECLAVTRFDAKGLESELHRMLSDTSHGCIAIVDGASTPNIAEILDASTLEHACLFRGSAREAVQSVAPWLVRLRPDNSTAKRIIRAILDQEAGHPVVPAMLLQSSRSLSDVVEHFRRISRIRAEEDGRWLHFRFADARTMNDLRASMSAEDAAIVLGDFTVLVPHPDGAFQMRSKNGGTRSPSRNSGFMLADRHIRAFQHRERAVFAHRMQGHVLRRFPAYVVPFAERLISVGMTLCRDSGLVQQDTTAGYIMLSAHLGLEFPRRYKRLSAILEPSRSEVERKTMIHAYLSEIDRGRS